MLNYQRVNYQRVNYQRLLGKPTKSNHQRPRSPSVAAGAGVDPGVAVALDAARCELAVVALVGHRPRNVLEEIYLCLGAKHW